MPQDMQQQARQFAALLRRRLNFRLALLRERYLQDFIFIHINKTGGTSVAAALAVRPRHKTAHETRQALGEEVWRRKFTFSVVRNPWDRVASHYHYRVLTAQTGLAESGMPFKEWVVRAYGEREAGLYDQPRMFMPQLDWLRDDSGRVLVDYIARFESLEQDFRVICRRLHREAVLPHLKRSRSEGYRQLYDPRSRQVVAERFAEDIDYFGYRW